MTFSNRRTGPVTIAAMLALAGAVTAGAAGRVVADSRDGIVRVKSAYGVGETVERLKKDIEGKGIKFFAAIDQAELGRAAGIDVKPSTLLLFGNPPLGIQFLTANPNAGLDWPVRLLVTEDDKGQVWATYTDFKWIAHRHRIANRAAQFEMASKVVRSITSSVETKP